MEQRLEAGDWPRHRHRAPYAAIVLSGGYLEAGGAGRWRVEAGDVLVHPPFDAHRNELPGRAWVLNIPLPAATDLPPVFRIADPDELERRWRRDPRSAAAMLTPAAARPPLFEDWPDLLAADIRSDPSLSISAWARDWGLAPATVTRGFSASFGVAPAAFRAERRVQMALGDLMDGRASLAAVAHDRGFSDQAHMSRSIRALTGLPPRAWRMVNSVQDSPGAPL